MKRYLNRLYSFLRAKDVISMEPRMKNIMNVLDSGHGNARSYSTKTSIDAEGNPIPWFTYPSIEYLRQLDLQHYSILEWGIGNSTLFFASRCKEILSIEHNKEWLQLITNFLPANARGILVEEEDYHDYPTRLNKKFDLIIVDGIKRWECLKSSVKLLSNGGVIIFDNSDRNPEYCEFLRAHNLIQVDFHGFGPIVEFTTTTSIFFSRDVDLRPLTKQPMVPIGGGY